MKFTVIWQSKTPHEFDWVEELFGESIEKHVYDGDHRIVADNALLVDAFINRFDAKYYKQFSGRNAFLLHVLDETYAGGYDRYENFKGVFRGHFSAGFNTDKVMNIPLGYYKKRPLPHSAKPAAQRPYIWSFVGEINKSTRPDVLRELTSCSPFLVISTSSMYGAKESTRERASLSSAQYYDLLENSVFSPSPMGNVNLECYRPYEALEAGSIPIVERRLFYDYYGRVLGSHPIPVVKSWAEASRLMNELVNNPEKLAALQSACLQFWQQYKHDLKANIGRFIERNSPLPNGGPMTSRLMGSKLYTYLELLKHHNVAALRRRLSRHLKRFRDERRWRVSS